MGIQNAWLVTAAGTGGTLAGLLAGFRLVGSPLYLLGIDVGKLWKGFPASLARLSTEICRSLGDDGQTFDIGDVPLVEGRYAAPKYGSPSTACLEAIRILAGLEGILLDPVYTAKAFAGMLELLDAGAFEPDNAPIIFLHTGGLPALFAFSDRLAHSD
jgi:1-aminocyclopropane-1-carboxylate deaminase/D-cysteine desulfhydrase-like pyridoxal-dependent ACC family enzyme